MTDTVTPLRPGRRTLAERILTRSQLRDLPEPQPLVHNTLDLGTVAVLAGAFGTLKSFIALDWAASVATGHAWHGRPAEPGRVLYVAAEGAHGLDQRLQAWEVSRRMLIPDAALHIYPDAVPLLDPQAVTELVAAVRDGRYRLVVIDTLAKSTVGMSENDAKEMGQAVAAAYTIRTATTDGTVVVIHHAGKDRTTIRGSSALEAGVDTVYLAEGNAGQVKLSRTKRKDGPSTDILTLHFQPVDGTRSGIATVHGGVDKRPGSNAVLSTYLSTFAPHGATMAQLRNASGMSGGSFKRAMDDLVSTGDLIPTGQGRSTRYTAPIDT